MSSPQWMRSKTSISGRETERGLRRVAEQPRSPPHANRAPSPKPDQLGDALGNAVRAVDALGWRAAIRLRASSGWVFLGDPRGPSDGLGDRPEGDPLAVGEAPPPKDERADPRVRESASRARRDLPDAGLAEDGHDAQLGRPPRARTRAGRPRSGSRPTIGVSKRRARFGAGDPVEEPRRGYGLGLALRLDGLEGLDLARRPNQPVGGSPMRISPGRRPARGGRRC